MRANLRYWLPVVLWMGVIFVMSTDIGSSTHTSRILEPIVRFVKPDASFEDFEFIHFIVRKCGHLSEYAVLALLNLGAVRRSRRDAGQDWSWKAAGVSLLIAAIYAATDEWHQSFIPGRTAAVADVLIDSSGAFAGLVLAFLRRVSG